MKKTTKAIIIIAFIVSVGISFWAGGRLNDYADRQNRRHACNNLISFAIDKVNTQELSDPDTMEALISNIYAAYLYCDEAVPGDQLHDLWNFLIFEGESFIGKEEALLDTLKDISAMVSSDK